MELADLFFMKLNLVQLVSITGRGENTEIGIRKDLSVLAAI
jgi:hypothetical protein